MKMGRACVVLSDDWHPHDGVDWDSFSIRVPESEAARLPEILKELERLNPGDPRGELKKYYRVP